jgi:hypothetical protein
MSCIYFVSFRIRQSLCQLMGNMLGRKAKRPGRGVLYNYLAEKGGFEPPLGYYPKHAFQACDLNHSSTSPKGAQDKPERVLPQPNTHGFSAKLRKIAWQPY